jgi:ribonuclease BN (tRNA processing enzyme)|tara:strand:+ start:492 stop:1430 length:939 start_codon:yes stop_codon:yes gene_type:complete
MMHTHIRTILCRLACFTLVVICSTAYTNEQCGDKGVWIQILGAGGEELNDKQASSSYLVWLNNEARVLIDTGPGSSVGFDKSGANFESLDAIVYTQLRADHSSDLPAYILGSYGLSRSEPLTIFGPDKGQTNYPGTIEFIQRLIGPNGAYPKLADSLTYKSMSGYKIRPREVPSTGSRVWSRFGTENLRLSSIPVGHSDFPTVAWRVDIDGFSIVFTGDFNNQKNQIAKFAKNTDALVVTHAIPEVSRGTLRNSYVLPSQIGRIAKQANARMVVLGHRTNRTKGRESQSRSSIEGHYTDDIIFADDLECWGL